MKYVLLMLAVIAALFYLISPRGAHLMKDLHTDLSPAAASLREATAFQPTFEPVLGVLSAGEAQALVLDHGGAPYAWGSNRDLQLGLPGRGTFNLPQPVPAPAGWRYIHVGTSANYALDQSSHLWRQGFVRNSYNNSPEAYTALFPERSWRKVEARWRLGVGLSDAGQLLAWHEEALDGNTRYLDGSLPRLYTLSPAQSWSDFCVGMGNIVAVASDGSLWRSRTPPEMTANVLSPINPDGPAPATIAMTRIEAPTRFVHVYCRDNAGQVIALDEHHLIWGYGRNEAGQLGDGKEGDSTYEPQRQVRDRDIKLLNTQHWMDIAVAPGFTLGIAGDGSLWAWGSNSDGLLGSNQHIPAGPVLVDQQHAWRAVAAGYHFGLGLTREGQIFAWGLGAGGVLADGGAAERRTTPTPIVSDTVWKTQE